MWPSKDWPEDSASSFFYYLTDEVEAFEIFSWQGQDRIGPRKEQLIDFVLEIHQEKIFIR